MSKWYKKSMPNIKEVTKSLPKLTEKLKMVPHLKKAYISGDYVAHKNNPNYRIKNIDIVVKANFLSEDLLAINNDIIKLHGKKEYLEEQGYCPKAIKFSQNLLSIEQNNLNFWAISKDKKLLHWGPIPENVEELNMVNKDAEEYAHKTTGFNLSKMKKISETKRENWYNVYKNYLNTYFSDMPLGWYKSNVSLKNMIKSSMEI